MVYWSACPCMDVYSPVNNCTRFPRKNDAVAAVEAGQATQGKLNLQAQVCKRCCCVSYICLLLLDFLLLDCWHLAYIPAGVLDLWSLLQLEVHGSSAAFTFSSSSSTDMYQIIIPSTFSPSCFSLPIHCSVWSVLPLGNCQVWFRVSVSSSSRSPRLLGVRGLVITHLQDVRLLPWICGFFISLQFIICLHQLLKPDVEPCQVWFFMFCTERKIVVSTRSQDKQWGILCLWEPGWWVPLLLFLSPRVVLLVSFSFDIALKVLSRISKKYIFMGTCVFIGRKQLGWSW